MMFPSSGSFDVYRMKPLRLRQMICSKLAWSIKQLLDGWPYEHFRAIEGSADQWITRLISSHADGCDFGLHHHLLLHLLEDNFDAATALIKFAAKRRLHPSGSCLHYGALQPNEEQNIYQAIFSINDFNEGELVLAAPEQAQADRFQSNLEEAVTVLQQASPRTHKELEAFRPIWLLATTDPSSKRSFGGYSSSLAWSTIALNTKTQGAMPVLVQVVHEMAHQLLFALAVDVPLAFNQPDELFTSPLRPDPRPMDGVLHASFVSARVHDVLRDLEDSPSWETLSSPEKQYIQHQRNASLQAAVTSLPSIDAGARLSALGERVVAAIRQATQAA